MKYILLLILFFPLVAFGIDTFGIDKEHQLKFSKLAENVYQHTSHKIIEPWGMVEASGLVIVDGSNAHIIDTPWTIAETKKLTEWIKSKGLILKTAVVTHFHEDASGGLSFLNGLQIKTYANQLTNKLLKQKQREQASHNVSGNTLELVKGSIEIYYPGAGHTQDNMVVWLPKAKMLFGGCFVKSLNNKRLGNIEDASIIDWPKSMQRLIDKYPGVEIVVPGHGKIGNGSLLTHTLHLTLAAGNR